MATRTETTETLARVVAAADGRDGVLWESAAPGLGLRVRPNGRKTWVVHRRCNDSPSGGRSARRRRRRITNRYVHLDDATLSQAAERLVVAIQPKLCHLKRAADKRPVGDT